MFTIRQQTALKGASNSSYGTWCLLHAEVYMKSSDCDPVGMLKACCEGTMHQKFRQTKKVTTLCTLCILSCHTCVKNVIFTQYLPVCNSRTAQRRNLVLDLYCRASQELLSGSWIMRIGWSELRCPTFSARHFFKRLRIACTKPFTTELMDDFGLWDLNEMKVKELLYLLVFVWSPRREVWPR